MYRQIPPISSLKRQNAYEEEEELTFHWNIITQFSHFVTEQIDGATARLFSFYTNEIAP